MAGYTPLILGLPGYVAVPAAFEAASTRECPGSVKLVLQVSVGAVWVQFGLGIAAPVWGTEELFLPTQGSLVRNFDAVRVRRFSEQSPPQVILQPIAGPVA